MGLCTPNQLSVDTQSRCSRPGDALASPHAEGAVDAAAKSPEIKQFVESAAAGMQALLSIGRTHVTVSRRTHDTGTTQSHHVNHHSSHDVMSDE